MKKIWQVKEKFPDNFKQENSGLEDIVLQLLWNRNLKEKAEINNFLFPGLENILDPFGLVEMEKAVEKIIRHIKAGSKITIYGDYDADGVTASVLMVEVLNIMHANASARIPNRVSEGYGLNRQAIKDIAADGTKLLITVDNGIRNCEEIAYAQKKGLDTIITDHHIPPEAEAKMPDSVIIDPNLKRENYNNKNLSGVGVAFKVASALAARSKLSQEQKKKLEELILDLVSIGTITDCVSLLGENRDLVREGLKRINNTKRIGLKQLIAVSGIAGKKLDAWNIGFQIGPRLNAAGRMGSANTAYELLITKDKAEAETLARRLNDRNIKRQEQTEEIFKKVEKQITATDKLIIGVYAHQENEEPWNEGIIGLVSGRITSKYYRPSLVITKTKDEYKGSGRGIPEINMIGLIEEAGEYLSKYGGHPGACGFSLAEKQLKGFIKRIKELAGHKLAGADLRPKLEIDAWLDLCDLDKGLSDEILNFSPFGTDNPRPVFASKNLKILDIIYMGIDGQHIKLRVKGENSPVFTALGFSQAEKWSEASIGDAIDLAYNIDLNEFNNKTEVQLKILDIKPHD